MIGVSVRTLQNWEQGRRKPEGPAKALLRIASRNPMLFLMLCMRNRISQQPNSLGAIYFKAKIDYGKETDT
ncbi:MAG: hypothetical protein J7K15_08420 [Deltaproteobacteria bacterium]|nr:hypothetical protein [Deltaproteobacteria bacterium]